MFGDPEDQALRRRTTRRAAKRTPTPAAASVPGSCACHQQAKRETKSNNVPASHDD
jgi:hypothetical protein